MKRGGLFKDTHFNSKKEKEFRDYEKVKRIRLSLKRVKGAEVEYKWALSLENKLKVIVGLRDEVSMTKSLKGEASITNNPESLLLLKAEKTLERAKLYLNY